MDIERLKTAAFLQAPRSFDTPTGRTRILPSVRPPEPSPEVQAVMAARAQMDSDLRIATGMPPLAQADYSSIEKRILACYGSRAINWLKEPEDLSPYQKQERIDEEGCGAVMCAAKFWSVA